MCKYKGIRRQNTGERGRKDKLWKYFDELYNVGKLEINVNIIGFEGVLRNVYSRIECKTDEHSRREKCCGCTEEWEKRLGLMNKWERCLKLLASVWWNRYGDTLLYVWMPECTWTLEGCTDSSHYIKMRGDKGECKNYREISLKCNW